MRSTPPTQGVKAAPAQGGPTPALQRRSTSARRDSTRAREAEVTGPAAEEGEAAAARERAEVETEAAAAAAAAAAAPVAAAGTDASSRRARRASPPSSEALPRHPSVDCGCAAAADGACTAATAAAAAAAVAAGVAGTGAAAKVALAAARLGLGWGACLGAVVRDAGAGGARKESSDGFPPSIGAAGCALAASKVPKKGR